MGGETHERYGFRNRKRRASASVPSGVDQLLETAVCRSRVVVFSGSGLSASSGMSTFSTKGGLYERAQAKFGLQDGKKLFCYSFFDKQRQEVQPFFADIHKEASRAQPAIGHLALNDIHKAGCLVRHYTLNIDGLAAVAGMPTWHPNFSPDGVTVEMHGNVKHLVCPCCACVTTITPPLLKALRSRTKIECTVCQQRALRWKVMMYDDDEGGVITPEGVFELLEQDLAVADLILWVGLSFEQSATVAYFRRVRNILMEHGRLQVPQAVINVSDEAMWNIMSSCCNQGDLNLLEVLAPCDDVLPQVAQAILESRNAPPPAAHNQTQLLSLPDPRKPRTKMCSHSSSEATRTTETRSAHTSTSAQPDATTTETTSPSRLPVTSLAALPNTEPQHSSFAPIESNGIKPEQRSPTTTQAPITAKTEMHAAPARSATGTSGNSTLAAHPKRLTHNATIGPSAKPEGALEPALRSDSCGHLPRGSPRKGGWKTRWKTGGQAMELAESGVDAGVLLLEEFARRTAVWSSSDKGNICMSSGQDLMDHEDTMQTAISLLSSLTAYKPSDGALDTCHPPVLDTLCEVGSRVHQIGRGGHPGLEVAFPRKRRSNTRRGKQSIHATWQSFGGQGVLCRSSGGEIPGIGGVEHSSSSTYADRDGHEEGSSTAEAWHYEQSRHLAVGLRLGALMATMQEHSGDDMEGLTGEGAWLESAMAALAADDFGDNGYRVRRTRRGEY